MSVSIHFLTKLAFPLLICVFALGYRASIEEAPRAARLFPDGLLSILILGCVVQAARSIYLQWSKGEGEGPELTLNAAQIMVLAAMVAFYPAVLLFGFGLPSLAFLFCVSLLCGATYRQALLVTIIAAAALYGFVRLSGFALPLY
jgi:hypothetical protein